MYESPTTSAKPAAGNPTTDGHREPTTDQMGRTPDDPAYNPFENPDYDPGYNSFEQARTEDAGSATGERCKKWASRRYALDLLGELACPPLVAPAEVVERRNALRDPATGR